MQNIAERYFGLQNRRAVVTGAGRGIGRAIAEAFAGMGAEVLVHYHSSEDKAEQVVETILENGGKAWAVGADLTEPASAKKLFAYVEERWGALDILVNNAGDMVKRCNIEDLSDDLIETVLQTNIHTALYSARTAIPLLRKGTKPSIVNLGSIAAHNGGAIGATLYAATKGAIHTFTVGLARELAPQIRVNAIAPGTIETDFHVRHNTEENLRAVAQRTLLQRNGTADDMAASVLLLCGDGGAFITGEVININGGLWFA